MLTGALPWCCGDERKMQLCFMSEGCMMYEKAGRAIFEHRQYYRSLNRAKLTDECFL